MAPVHPVTPRRGVPRASHLRQVSNGSSISTAGPRPKTPASNPTSSTGPARDPIDRRATVWVHDEHFSKDDVVLNLNLFLPGSVREGEVLAIVPLKTDSSVRDFQSGNAAGKKDLDGFSVSMQRERSSSNSRLPTNGFTTASKHDVNANKPYLFVVRDMLKEQKIKYPGLEVSIAKPIADVFGFKNRTLVVLKTVSSRAHGCFLR
jgi:hypothetical protein